MEEGKPRRWIVRLSREM